MPASRLWRFAPFELDLAEQRLLRQGCPVPLAPKAMALLALLLERAGHLVPKDEVFATVWAGRMVTDAALARVLRELRAALGDDAAQPRYVQTAHGLGLRFVAEVDATVPAAPHTQAPALPGRAAERALLAEALQAVRGRQRRVMFVSAPAGMGKTTLVSSALAEAGECWVGTGRCIPQYGPEEAHLPMLEALEQLAAAVGAAAMREHLLRYAPAWLAQLPWLVHDVAPDALAHALHGGSPARMLREFAQALEVLSRQRPVVLWLEDLHWSDRSSLDVLAFLAGRREPARLLVLATLRPPLAQAPLAALLGRLANEPHCQTLALSHLDEPAMADLAAGLLPGPDARAAPPLLALLQQRSGGNPLFGRAVLHDLLRGNGLVASAQGWTARHADAPALPDTLRQLVLAQLEHLAPADQALVEAAAVAGAAFAAALPAAALQQSEDDVAERCAQLCGEGGFFHAADATDWPDGSASAGYVFVHALYQEAVFDRVPEARRSAWQRRMAERLAQAHAADLRPVAAELALRWQAAHHLPQAVACLRLAADAALARFAYPEAVSLLRRAEHLMAERAGPQPELLLSLGAALIATQGYAADEVQAVYGRALALARAQGADGLLERAMRGQWNVALVRADLAQAAALAKELAQRAASRGAEARFDALAKQGQTAMHLGRFGAARTQLAEALALRQPGAVARESPRVAGYLSWVLWHLGLPDQALAAAEQALALAAAEPSPHSAAFAGGFVAWLHVFRGEWPRAMELARAQAQLSQEHGLVYWAAWSRLLLGLGHDEPALGLHESAAALADFAAIGAEVGLAHFHAAHAQACLAQGRLDDARGALTVSERLQSRNGNAYHAAETLRLRGELALAEGDAAAPGWLEQALALARQQGARALALRALTSLARLHGRPELLAQLRAERLAFSEGQLTADLRAADAVLGL